MSIAWHHVQLSKYPPEKIRSGYGHHNCYNPLNWDLVTIARSKGIKVYIQSNYEFCDNLIKPHLPLPDMFLMPSFWMLEEMQARYGRERVRYLPPPVFPEEFTSIREMNLNRTGKARPWEGVQKRFLHTVGTLAAADRNGTLILIEAIKYAKTNFELIIKSQHDLPREYISNDTRIKYQIGSQNEPSRIYRDFDAVILPRRFGGLSLPMQEALMSGLPVIMPDISPNSSILPARWLIPAKPNGSIVTRTRITLYEADPRVLATRIDLLCATDISTDKIEAFEIAHREFAPSSLENEYNKLWL